MSSLAVLGFDVITSVSGLPAAVPLTALCFSLHSVLFRIAVSYLNFLVLYSFLLIWISACIAFLQRAVLAWYYSCNEPRSLAPLVYESKWSVSNLPSQGICQQSCLKTLQPAQVEAWNSSKTWLRCWDRWLHTPSETKCKVVTHSGLSKSSQKWLRKAGKGMVR